MSINEAWEEIKILVNSDINDLCNQNRHCDAKELENCRDMIDVALRLAGYDIKKDDL